MTSTYTGHEKDYETNLTYMLARYYSQGYGRFLSPDPGYDYDQLDPMSWNLYSYVRGNPVAYADPSGTTIEVTSLSEEERERLIKELTRLANYKSKQKLEIVTEEKDGKVYLKFKDFDASKVNNVAKDLNEVMEDTKQNVRVIAANGSNQVYWMESYREDDTIKIDFQDKFPKCLTMGMGMQFMHELTHIRKRWGEPVGRQPDGTFIPRNAVSGYVTGKVVDYVNERYRAPLGLSIRGGYMGSRDSFGRPFIPFYSGYNGITVIWFYPGKYLEDFDK